MSRALEKAKAGASWMSKIGGISGMVVGALVVGLAIASGGTTLAATPGIIAAGAALGAVAGGVIGALTGAAEGFSIGGLWGSISDSPKAAKVTIVTHGVDAPAVAQQSQNCDHCRSDHVAQLEQRASTPRYR